MDKLDSMRMLLAVVDAGSLSAAGRKLGTPLATVSRKISDLESALGASLLMRTSRRLALTEAGAHYVASCRRIIESIDEAEQVARGEYDAPMGELALSAPIVFGRLHVLPIITDFLKEHPAISIKLIQNDRIADFHAGEIDLAVRIGALPDSSLIALRLGVLRHIICASPAYFAARGRPDSPEALADHDCIAFDVLSVGHEWRFVKDGAPLPVAIRPRLIVNTAEAAVDAAVSGVGVARVISYQAAEAIGAKTLEIALGPFEPPPFPVSFLYANNVRMPRKLRAFLDFAVPRLRERLS